MHAPFPSRSVTVTEVLLLLSPVGGSPVFPSRIDVRASGQFSTSLLSFIAAISRSTSTWHADVADVADVANVEPSSPAKDPVAANASNPSVNHSPPPQALSSPASTSVSSIGLPGHLTTTQVILIVMAVLLVIIVFILIVLFIRRNRHARHDAANENKRQPLQISALTPAQV